MGLSRKPAHLCITKFCRKPRSTEHGGLCSRCSLRQWRAANPIKAKLAILRDRAKRKKVPFDLTVEWLTEFLATHHYDPKEHHIDRIKTWLGYTMDNLQVLPMSENIAKGNRERYGKLWMSAVVDEPF
jgi:hypothetical protein